MNIVQRCYKCAGVGIWTKNTPDGDVVYDPCPVCLGDKNLEAFSVVNPSGVFHAYLVYEAIDHAEYVALTSPNEEHVDAITGCDLVDLSEGSRARTVLWDLFDSESTTRANLITLIG